MKVLPQQRRLVQAGVDVHTRLNATGIEMLSEYAPEVLDGIKLKSVSNLTVKLLNADNFDISDLLNDENKLFSTLDAFNGVNEVKGGVSKVVSIIDGVATVHTLNNASDIWNIPISDTLIFVKMFSMGDNEDDVEFFCDMNILYMKNVVTKYIDFNIPKSELVPVDDVNTTRSFRITGSLYDNFKYLKMINLKNLCSILTDSRCITDSDISKSVLYDSVMKNIPSVLKNIGKCDSMAIPVITNIDSIHDIRFDSINSVIAYRYDDYVGRITFVEIDGEGTDTFVHDGVTYYNLMGADSKYDVVIYAVMSENVYNELLARFSNNEYVDSIGVSRPFVLKKNKWLSE